MSASPLLSSLGLLSLQAAVVVLLILLAQTVLRPWLSPRWRCALWLLLIGRLLLPVAPSSRLSVFNFFAVRPAAEMAAEPAPVSVEAALPALAGHALLPGDGTAASAIPLVPATCPVNWAHVAGLVWLAGFLLFLIQVGRRSVRCLRRLSHSAEIADPATRGIVARCSNRLGVRTPPAVCESPFISGPVLIGLFRPKILLPPGFAERYGGEDTSFAVLHEIVHLKRGDLVLNWVATVLQAVHWFNPLVWLGFARWRADREFACDAAVLEMSGGNNRQRYGEFLIRLLENGGGEPPVPVRVGVSEVPGDLRTRLRMIGNFKPASRWSIAAVVPVAIFGACCLTDPSPPPAPVAEQPDAAASTAASAPIPVSARALSFQKPAATRQAPVPPPAGAPTFVRTSQPRANQPPHASLPARSAAIPPIACSAPPPSRNPALHPPSIRARPTGAPVATSTGHAVLLATLPVATDPAIAPLPGVRQVQAPEPILLAGVGATGIPYGFSPAAYGKVTNLREALALSDAQTEQIGHLYMKEDQARAELGSHPAKRVIAAIHRDTLNRIRLLLAPAQRADFNLLPSSVGGGLIGISPLAQLARLDELVHLSEAQKWPTLEVYLAGTERLMDCQTPEQAEAARRIRLAMMDAVRGMLTASQRAIWDATPQRKGGGLLASAS